jgi:recombination protein RecA
MSVIRKKITKEYGDIFLDYNSLVERKGIVIPTTLSLDIGLNGGWLEGTVGMVSGKTSCGKTTLCLTIAAAAQRLGKKIYYDDAEMRLRPELLATIGGLDLSPEKFEILKSSDRFLTAENHLNILNNLFDSEPNILIILDSIASLCPDSLHTVEHGETKKMMALPAIMYDNMRKIVQVLPHMKSNLIGITHVQANPSPYGGPAEVGGNAWKYFSSYHVSCLSSMETPKDGVKTGRESKYKIYKTALGPGTGESTFYIKYGHGYDRELDIINMADELGFVSQSASWFSLHNSKNEEIKMQGKENLVEYLKQNPLEAELLENNIKKLSSKK